MRVQYGTIAGRLVSGVLLGVMGLVVVGCEPPDMVSVAPPGAPIPKQSPDEEPASAQGEMASPLRGETPLPKAQDYTPAPPTAKGETKTTKRGVQYETLKEGTGPVLEFSQTGQFLYVGKLEDGTVFDSNRESGKPMERPLANLIEGWQEGLPGMKVGETRKLIIPPVLGYGAKGSGDKIPPDATLVFEVELVGIKGN
jgi:FKBP-type peptidyl-prolyl cis-trans isomerase